MNKLLGVSLGIALLGLGGCPKKDVTIYRSLTEPARQTCDANTRVRAEQLGKDAAEAKAKVDDEIRAYVTKHEYCGAFITNEGAGKTLDGPYRYVADYQLCKCQ